MLIIIAARIFLSIQIEFVLYEKYNNMNDVFLQDRDSDTLWWNSWE